MRLGYLVLTAAVGCASSDTPKMDKLLETIDTKTEKRIEKEEPKNQYIEPVIKDEVKPPVDLSKYETRKIEFEYFLRQRTEQESEWIFTDEGEAVCISEAKPSGEIVVRRDFYESFSGKKKVTMYRVHKEPSIPKEYSFEDQAELKRVLRDTEVTPAIAVTATGLWKFDTPRFITRSDSGFVFAEVRKFSGLPTNQYIERLKHLGYMLEFNEFKF